MDESNRQGCQALSTGHHSSRLQCLHFNAEFGSNRRVHHEVCLYRRLHYETSRAFLRSSDSAAVCSFSTTYWRSPHVDRSDSTAAREETGHLQNSLRTSARKRSCAIA